jgi:hypothetical protein
MNMGLFSGILGMASETSTAELQEELQPLLVEGEKVVKGYKFVRDMIVFTDRRLILVEKEGMTGLKGEYQTIPYSSIIRFSKVSAGPVDLDAEMKIWVRGQPEPISREFTRGADINEAYRLLSLATTQVG